MSPAEISKADQQQLVLSELYKEFRKRNKNLNEETIAKLLEQLDSSNINNTDNLDRKNTLLHYYVFTNGNVNILTQLLKKGANINQPNGAGNTPLHFAAVVKYKLEIMKQLIEKGADINAQNNTGYTPLHNAVDFSEIDYIKELIIRGADMNIKDKEGKTAFDILKSNFNDPTKLVKYSTIFKLLNFDVDCNNTCEMKVDKCPICYEKFINGDKILYHECGGKPCHFIHYDEYETMRIKNDNFAKCPVCREVYTAKNTKCCKLELDVKTTGGKSKHLYNGRYYSVHSGKRGGQYILVGQQKRKVYILFK